MLKENLYNQWIIHTCNEDSLDLLSIDEYYEIEHEPQVENSTLVLFRPTEETVWTSSYFVVIVDLQYRSIVYRL